MSKDKIINKNEINPEYSWKGAAAVTFLLLAALACNLPGKLGASDAAPSPTSGIDDVIETQVSILTVTPTPTTDETEEPEIEPPATALPTLQPNLATNQETFASVAEEEHPSSHAVDGIFDSIWNAGQKPEQWIEVNLGRPAEISAIRLYVSQTPAGNTVHELSVSANGNNFEVIHTFSGPTEDGQVLEFKPDIPLGGVQFVMVTTTESPSWGAWKEIEVIGESQ